MSSDLDHSEDSARLKRVEEKLDALLAALAAECEEEQEAPVISLDGDHMPGERNQSQSLG